MQEVKISRNSDNHKFQSKNVIKHAAVAISKPFSKASLNEIRVDLINRYFEIKDNN